MNSTIYAARRNRKLSAYRNPELIVETKSDDTPVTFADREAEREIREAIQVLYPEHGIKGEEFDDVNPDAEMTWIIDPIDGTKSFAAGSPLFGTMIALLERGQPIYGCINYPAIGDRISGDGEAAYVNGSHVTATVGKPLDKSILLCTDQGYIDQVKGSKNLSLSRKPTLPELGAITSATILSPAARPISCSTPK